MLLGGPMVRPVHLLLSLLFAHLLGVPGAALAQDLPRGGAAAATAPAPQAAAAPAPPPPVLGRTEAEHLIGVLQDPGQRAALLATLEALVQATAPGGTAAAPDSATRHAPAAPPVPAGGTAGAAPAASATPTAGTAAAVPAVAGAAPPAAAPPAAAAGKPAAGAASPDQAPGPLTPGSLGAQIQADVSKWLVGISARTAASAQTLLDLPLLARWLQEVATDPSIRAPVLESAWKLAAVLAIALGVEWAVWWLLAGLRRTLAREGPTSTPPPAGETAGPETAAPEEAEIEAPGTAEPGTTAAPPERRRRLTSAWAALRRLPLAVARLLLDLLPLVAFLALGNALLATPLGQPGTTRLVILEALQAYAILRTVMAVTRALIDPEHPGLRLLRVSDSGARFIESWMRSVVTLAVLGVTFADIAGLLGLYAEGQIAIIKLVGLAVHIMLAGAILRARVRVAAIIAPPVGARGTIAAVRRRLAGSWHWIAIIYNFAIWLVYAVELRNGFVRLLHAFLTVAAVAVLARLLGVVVMGALDRALRPGREQATRHPVLQVRANRYYPVLRAVVSLAIGIGALIVLLEFWGVAVLVWFNPGGLGRRMATALLTIGVTTGIALIVWESANSSLEISIARLSSEGHVARAVRLRTLQPILRTGLLITVLVIVGLTALTEIGVNIGPLLAGAGIVGVAIGFGSQKLVQDLITGLFLLLENTMQVGDWVTVSGLSGSVEHLSIRTIRLRAGDGSVHIIPFSAVTSVTNTNRGIGNASVSVSVAAREDTDRVAAVLSEIVAGMRQDPEFRDRMLSDLQLWGVDKVDGYMATILGQIVCTDTGRWPVQREFNRRMKRRLQELGVALAAGSEPVVVQEFTVLPPERGQPRDGDAPPALPGPAAPQAGL